MTKITIDRALLEQASKELDALKQRGVWGDFDGVADALRAKLAEPVQEPAPMPPFPPVSQWKRGCAVCGLGADGKAYGYACPRSDCPTRVACGGAV